MKTEPVSVENIVVPPRHRQVSDDAVARLAESMKTIGLMTPITIHSPEDDSAWLVAGHHRLAAAKLLGWDTIDAFIVSGDEVDMELREIAENLHRADLTELEKSDHVARWAELMAARVAQNCATLPGGHQPAEKGIRKIAADLKMERRDVQRAVKVASLSEEAKEAAREVGLDNNRSALLDAAGKTTIAEQVAAIHQRHTQGAKVIKLADEPLNDMEAAEKQVAALMSAWNKAGKAAREEFLLRIEQPVMDRQFA
jgi:ParB-like chromosome segregation protein Spo0J